MCGRYATTRTATDLSAIFDAPADDEVNDSIAVDYNVAPTDPVPIVRMSASSGGRVLNVARWGLLPPWASDRRVGARMINARAESVATTRAFAKPFATRRALIPATGWYEFAPAPATAPARVRKQPYFMTRWDGQPLAFAGIWSLWRDPDAPEPAAPLLSCSIITTEAIGELTAVHNRMPLILPPDRWTAWLTATTELEALLTPPTVADVKSLEIRPVGYSVGDVRNDGPELIARLDEDRAEPVDLTLF